MFTSGSERYLMITNKQKYNRVKISDTYPINSHSLVAADTNFYKTSYNGALEKWHRAPFFQFMTRQSYPRQFFFGADGLRLSPCSPFPRLFIFFWVWTSRWDRRWWRRATTFVGLYVVHTFLLVSSDAFLSVVVFTVILIRVHILSFQSFLLQLFFFFLRLLLLQQLRWTSQYLPAKC